MANRIVITVGIKRWFLVSALSSMGKAEELMCSERQTPQSSLRNRLHVFVATILSIAGTHTMTIEYIRHTPILAVRV